jgi:hypothetical protein
MFRKERIFWRLEAHTRKDYFLGLGQAFAKEPFLGPAVLKNANFIEVKSCLSTKCPGWFL